MTLPRTVLIVDDEEDIDCLIQQKFRHEIKTHRLIFLFARHGVAALDLLKKTPELSMVITDIHMPLMNGIELLTHIKKQYPSIKVFVMSAYTDKTNMDKATLAGSDGFISKPLHLNHLKDIIL